MQSTPRVAFVTGASRGIGARCAALLASRGLRVYGASRSGQAPPGVIALTMDAADSESVHTAAGRVLRDEGRVDIVVNNAGMGIAGAVEDTSIDEAQAQFEVNFFGPLRICHAVLPAMRANGSGYIVNVGSIGGLIAIPYQGLYSASKFALEGLTESLRIELRPFGIRVALIEPGDHATGFTGGRRLTAASQESVYATRANRAIEQMAADEQRGSSPDEVARLLWRIVNTRNPRLRYTTGPFPQRAGVWARRLLPNALMERIVRSIYHC